MRWSQLALPDARDELAGNTRRAADLADRRAADPSTAVRTSLSPTRIAEIGAALRADALHLRSVEMAWVSRDMTRLALDASTDMPDWPPGTVMPFEVGLLIWDGAMPKVRWAGTTRGPADVPLDGVAWWTTARGVHLTLLTLGAHINDLLFPPWRGARLFPVGELTTPFRSAEATTFDVDRNAAFTDQRDVARAVIAAVGATWTLMMQPQISSTARAWQDPDRNREGKPPRPTPDVLIIDLRPSQTRSTVTDTALQYSGRRTYRHRWIVRGHWRQQPYGPGRTLRRPQWIEGHIAGPDGAPLLVQEHVHVWRR